ncbi:Beta-fructofuranosidase, insoluble isoenzyme 3 [Penicillium subrubescens]|uniref:Beta-fructofuranosidase, insoluble isoenzyme 3 n=1 Tax=Penicillium subrubescens TaxID=1316194 RepID=A0A1Q5TE87_9EURO|nr:Beta-fructofuranosidase, insoluble isoenzyme 3 [Penicillium subrubescens]
MSVLLSSPDPSGHKLREKHAPTASQEPDRKKTSNLATSKPSFHLTAPSGWMNDPCGLGYDPTTGLYHLFFQWNPHGNDWGNMSWGHATSTNLVSWKVSPTPALTPSTEYDRCGIFTGCLQATDIYGNPGSLTAMYTSVRHLPLHHTLPYITGCESLSLAVSNNGGKTWDRLECNPILAGPPEHLPVTGWRDPHLTTWPEEQTTSSGSPQHPLHGIVAGGITGKAPAIFVYTVNPTDLRSWTYTGILVDVGLNFHPSRWSGDFGVNWEVGNLMTLSNNGVSRDFAIMGAEGCLRFEDSLWETPGTAQQHRQARSQLWMCIKPRTLNTVTNLHKNENEALAGYVFGGYFDHGCLYAANSFWDPLTSQRIVYGWITEEDLPDEHRHRQGWSGMISLPRVVDLVTLKNVTKARNSKLESITSIEAIPNNHPSELQTYTIHTLGIKPDPRLCLLRDGAERRYFPDEHLPVSLRDTSDESLSLTSNWWELEAEFSVGSSCGRVGIQIAHTTGKS